MGEPHNKSTRDGNMIAVENLKKSYGSQAAVDGISFHVKEGEIYGFLGPNGAGKTTTISMISGLLKPDSGRTLISGIDIWLDSKKVKRMIGVVPQETAVYEELSAVMKEKTRRVARSMSAGAGEIALPDRVALIRAVKQAQLAVGSD